MLANQRRIKGSTKALFIRKSKCQHLKSRRWKKAPWEIFRGKRGQSAKKEGGFGGEGEVKRNSL